MEGGAMAEEGEAEKLGGTTGSTRAPTRRMVCLGEGGGTRQWGGTPLWVRSEGGTQVVSGKAEFTAITGESRNRHLRI